MRIERKLEILWGLGSWNGMLSCICLLDDRKHYVKCLDESYEDGNLQYDKPEQVQIVYGPNEIYDLSYASRVRVYAIYKLTDDEIEKMTYWHEEFRKHVGHHTDYKDGSTRNLYDSDNKSTVKSQSGWKNFYDRKEEREADQPSLTDDKIVALYIEHKLYH